MAWRGRFLLVMSLLLGSMLQGSTAQDCLWSRTSNNTDDFLFDGLRYDVDSSSYLPYQPTSAQGIITLTANEGGLIGVAFTNPLSESYKNMIAKFQMRQPCDDQLGEVGAGVSLSFGDAILSWRDDILSGTQTSIAEEGLGSGIRLSFDTYRNDWDDQGTGIDLFYGSTNLFHSDTPLCSEEFRAVDFRISDFGLASLKYGDMYLFTNLAIPNYDPQAYWQFAIAARTGLLYAQQDVTASVMAGCNEGQFPLLPTMEPTATETPLPSEIPSPTEALTPTSAPVDTSGSGFTAHECLWDRSTDSADDFIFDGVRYEVGGDTYSPYLPVSAQGIITLTADEEGLIGLASTSPLWGNFKNMIANFQIHYPCKDEVADGISLSFGADILPWTYPSFAEEGLGSGIRLSFDTYANEWDEQGTGIDLFYGNITLFHSNTSLCSDRFRAVDFRISDLGVAYLRFGDEILFTDIKIPEYNPQPDWRFAFAARTGLFYAQQDVTGAVMAGCREDPIPTPTEAATPTETPLPTDTEAPTDTPVPTDTEAPTKTSLVPHVSVTPTPHNTDVLHTTPTPLETNMFIETPTPLWIDISSATPTPLGTDAFIPTPTPLQTHISSVTPTAFDTDVIQPTPTPLQTESFATSPTPFETDVFISTPTPLWTHVPSRTPTSHETDVSTPTLLNLSGGACSLEQPPKQFLDLPPVILGGSFTIEGEFRLNEPPATCSRLFDFGNGPKVDEIFVGFCTEPDIQFSVLDAWSSTVGYQPTIGQWSHIALRCSAHATRTNCDLLVDGVVLASQTVSGVVPLKARSHHYIGKSLWSDPSIRLSVRSFRIWSKALSDAYLSQPPPTESIAVALPGLTVAYNFDNSCAIKAIVQTATPTPTPTNDPKVGDGELLVALNSGLQEIISSGEWSAIAARHSMFVRPPVESSEAYTFPTLPSYRQTLYNVLFVRQELRICRTAANASVMFNRTTEGDSGFEVDLINAVLRSIAAFYLAEQDVIRATYVLIEVPSQSSPRSVLATALRNKVCDVIEDRIVASSNSLASYGVSDAYLTYRLGVAAELLLNPALINTSFDTLVDTINTYPSFLIGVTDGSPFQQLLTGRVPAEQVVAYSSTSTGLISLGREVAAFGGSDVVVSSWVKTHNATLAFYPLEELATTSYRFVCRGPTDVVSSLR